MIVLRSPWDGLAPTMLAFTFFGSSTSFHGVSLIDLPAYLLSSGLMSNDSRCETPPQRQIQMTDLARGLKCGLPLGAMYSGSELALTMPSRKSIAPSARPVKPIPVSSRNERRETPGQRWEFLLDRSDMSFPGQRMVTKSL